MKKVSWIYLLVGIGLISLALLQIHRARKTLQIIRVPESDPPTTILAKTTALAEDHPLILVGHGFAGSELLMRGISFSLAHAGYIVAAWDFDGHGGNPNPYPQDPSREALLTNAASALEIVQAAGYSTGDRVAIIGHSMGSGVAQSFGMAYPSTSATIAVSPIPREVNKTLPKNLLYMAGSLEPGFVQNAQDLLQVAGGPGGEHAEGTARALSVIPGIEHISILFSPTSHTVIQQWLDQTFGNQPSGTAYTDRRMVWLGLGILGVFLMGWGITPPLNHPLPSSQRNSSPWSRWLAPILGALIATLIFRLFSQWGAPVDHLLNLVVGGYLLVFFGLAGSLSLIIRKFEFRPLRIRHVWSGLVTFGILWIGVGILSHRTWIPWFLIPKRLVLWPFGTALCLPWFLSVGETIRGEGWSGRISGWLLHSLLLSGVFVLSLRWVPGLGVLILVLPLLPVILGLIELANARLAGNWPFVISGSAFLSWILLAVFPMT